MAVVSVVNDVSESLTGSRASVAVIDFAGDDDLVEREAGNDAGDWARASKSTVTMSPSKSMSLPGRVRLMADMSRRRDGMSDVYRAMSLVKLMRLTCSISLI